jgi:hypothetical protein
MSLFPRTSNTSRNPQSPPVAQSNITCWRCYETGHYATTCPLNDTKRTLDPTENNLQPLPPRSKNT